MTIRCNLIIDSCCDLPPEIVHIDGIKLLKFPYFQDDVEHFDDLFTTSDPHGFYEAMRKGSVPKTAQVPYGTMLTAFEHAVESGVPTVYLAFSSGLSGNFETACAIRETITDAHPDAELHLVDTKLASIAEGLLVYEAIRQRERGMSASELAEWASEARFFIRSIFMVDDLESLSRGGRLPASVTYAGSKLDVKPMLSFDLSGRLALTGVSRGRKKAIRQMANYYSANASDYPGKRVIIGHADCIKDAERLQGALRKIDDTIPVIFSNTGPVIGSHVGPGMLSMVFWGRDVRESLSVADRIALKIKGE